MGRRLGTNDDREGAKDERREWREVREFEDMVV